VFDRSLLLLWCSAVFALLIWAPLTIVSAGEPPSTPASILDFHVKDIDGKDLALGKFKGKVLLIVNTASQCGFTPQYKELEAVYQKYKGESFEVLAFPANDFGKQEPGSNEQIKEFCSNNYKVTFPLFSKIAVDGDAIHPLYAYLTDRSTDPKCGGKIRWNFTKFLVNRKGEVVARFEPLDKPSSAKVTGAIEKALAEK
jgi:glutathione peroxidase